MCAQRLVCYCEAEININLGSRACRGFWWLKTEAVCHRATHQVPQSSQQRVVCCSLENSGPHLKNGSLSDIFQPEFISSISRHKAVFSFTLPAYAAFLSYFSSLFFFFFLFFQTWSSVAFRPGLSVFFFSFPPPLLPSLWRDLEQGGSLQHLLRFSAGRRGAHLHGTILLAPGRLPLYGSAGTVLKNPH